MTLIYAPLIYSYSCLSETSHFLLYLYEKSKKRREEKKEKKEKGQILTYHIPIAIISPMSRPLRIEFPGAIYHLTARGNARQNIFINDEDRQRFIDLLGREIEQQRWKCYAYCLMDNHYHLLIETPEGKLAQGMRRLNGVYTQSFNRRHGRVGHVLQGRYKSIVVERESYLLELCRYVVLNPVRAGIVKRVADWPWSSYRATAGNAKAPVWLASGWVLGQFGHQRQGAQAAYRRFVSAGIRSASPWEGIRGQVWLGEDGFLKRMQSMLKDKHRKEVPRGQQLPDRPSSETIIKAVSETYDVERRDILNRSHPQGYVAVVYLLRRVVNMRLNEVADLFGVSASRVSKIQKCVEEGRADIRMMKLLKKYKVKI